MNDIIILWSGGAGLFVAGQLPKEKTKIILEKNTILGIKVLMSGGERCNLSNINTSPEHYFWTHTQALHSLFKTFSVQEMRDFLHTNKIETKQEENGRIITKSNQSKELRDFLVKQASENNTQILENHEVLSVKKEREIFIITTSQGEFQSKNLIVATGGKSYPQAGATGIGWQIASNFGHTVTPLHPGLCGIETQEDMSVLAGNTCSITLNCYYHNKLIHQEIGSLLFTHRGVSGPTVFNTTIALGNYMNQKKIKTLDSWFTLGLVIDKTTVSKKMSTHFDLTTPEQILYISQLRPRSEAKVTVGGIPLNELKPNFESKKIPGLYFLGELIDITGKTGGFNLQRARTSAYNCAKKRI